MNGKAKAQLVMLLTLVYIVAPIDFAPDFLPGVGQLDDLAALLFGCKKAFGWLLKREN